MKKLLLILILALVSTDAMAKWTAVVESESYTQYADFTTISKEGNVVKMWDLLDFKTVHDAAGYKHLSQQLQREYDCKKEQSRLLTFTLFSKNMGTGKVLRVFSTPDKWEPVQLGSIGEVLWLIACDKR